MLVAISGGPDSTALLVALAHLKAEPGIQVRAANFDHRLRSREEAEGDAAFVGVLCRRLRVPVEFGAGNVRARARRKKESIEEAARAMRYAFLRRAAKRLGCTVVAVAHNRDDQAETVLMRMIRGAGLDGIAGMRPRARWPFARTGARMGGRGPDVIRPLLDVPRTEIERYCAELGVAPRRDPTNDQPVATRNRVRSELLPLLRTFNPRIEEALARLGEAAAENREANEFVEQSIWEHFAQPGEGFCTFPAKLLAGLELGFGGMLIRRAFMQLTGSTAWLTRQQVEAVLAVAEKGRGRVSLPSHVTATASRGNLTLHLGPLPRISRLSSRSLQLPGHTRVDGWEFRSEITDRPAGPLAGDPQCALLDSSSISGRLGVRARLPGDGIRPLGLKGWKKVQDILVDAKVPVEERDEVPIICDRKGPLWVVGYRIDERVAVTEKTKRVIRIVARRV